MGTAIASRWWTCHNQHEQERTMGSLAARRARRLIGWIGGIALLTVFTWVLAGLFRGASSLNQPSGAQTLAPTKCAPTPAPATEPPGPPTPTPRREDFGTIPPRRPTMTPYPISKTTDLSPQVSMQDKGHVVVFHCDGTYEMFLAADPSKPVPLQTGDVVIEVVLPESAQQMHPPAATTAAPPPSPTQLAPSTPAPTQAISTEQPYPVPATAETPVQ
jgi:hypothetical protein